MQLLFEKGDSRIVIALGLELYPFVEKLSNHPKLTWKETGLFPEASQRAEICAGHEAAENGNMHLFLGGFKFL